MNNKIKKIITIGLCVSLAAGTVCGTALAMNSDKPNKKITENINTNISSKSEKTDIVKDETVYVLANADGSVKKIIVSDWIKNTIGNDQISDKSDLTNIENVKGDESYTINGDNMHVWDTEGNDIYYQGNIEKELPVGITVSYKLDGKTISAEELVGKSGKVTIRFDYKNNQFHNVEIDGKQEKIYVPFAMLTGMLLDSNSFRNIEVTNGKLINDGDHTAVIGISFPGLQENLAISDDKLNIPNYVEITADVTKFEMTNTITIATNKIFNEIDTDKLNSIDDLTSALDEMSDAVNQLIDGSSELYDGLTTLLEKSNELISGINQLTEGAEKLKNGAGDLNNGANELANGTKTLADGLKEIASNNDNLNNGAKQVFESLLNMADSQIAAAGISAPKLTIENYSKVLNDVITSLSDTNKILAQAQTIAKQKVTEAVNSQKDVIAAKVSEAVKNQVSEKVTETVLAEVTNKVNEAVLAEVTSQVNEAVLAEVTNKVTETVKAEVTNKVTETVNNTVIEKVTEQVKAEVIAKITETVRLQIEEKVLASLNMTKEQYDTAVNAGIITEEEKSQINATIDTQMTSNDIKAIITVKTEEQMNSDEIKAVIDSNINNKLNSDEIQNTISNNITAQMVSDEVKTTIDSNIKAQMASDTIKKTITDNINNQMKSDTVKKTITDNINVQMASDTIKKTISDNTNSKMNDADIKNTIAQKTNEQVTILIEQNMKSEEVQSQINGAVTTAKAGITSIKSLISQLDSYKTFYTGLNQYTAGVASAKDGADTLYQGANQLKDGTAELNAGINELYNGIIKLKDGAPALIDGVTQLRDGAMQLSDGLKEFNEQGIKKLTNIVDDNINSLITRIKATVDVSKSYKSFSGISDDMDGDVKFIYRTDSIE